MFTFALPFLIFASLADSQPTDLLTGTGLCLVDGNYTEVDTSTWPQPQHPNFGTFYATAYNNDTRIVTTTYNAQDTLKITIASNGTDKIAGIVGYFPNPVHSPFIPQLRVGNWLLLDKENYTSTGACSFQSVSLSWPSKADGFTVFSDVKKSSRPFVGVPQSELSFEWSFNYFELVQETLTTNAFEFRILYAYSGMLYWTIIQANDSQTLAEAEGLYPSPAQVKAGLQNDTDKALKSGRMAFSANATGMAIENFIVHGLEPHTQYAVYYYAEIINPPMINFAAYVLTGETGDNSTQQLYRTVAGDRGNLLLVPETNPLLTAVKMMQPVPTLTSVAYTAGPAMFLIALCLWISSSQMFL